MGQEPGLIPESAEAALIQAESASEALQNLYQYYKAQDKKYSMSYIAKKAGLSSSGFISDLLSGRRKLRLEHCRGLSKAFQLELEAKQLLKTFAQLEGEEDEKEKAVLLRRRDLLKKALRVGHRKNAGAVRDMTTAFEVFCAFSLFDNRPRLEDLLDYFGHGRRKAITEALDALKALKMVGEDGERWQLLVNHIIFGEDGISQSHISFLQAAMQHASGQVEAWFPKRDLAYFTSSIITVEKEQYMRLLENFRSQMMVWQSELESGKADSMVRVNVQIYPVKSALEYGEIAPETAVNARNSPS